MEERWYSSSNRNRSNCGPSSPKPTWLVSSLSLMAQTRTACWVTHTSDFSSAYKHCRNKSHCTFPHASRWCKARISRDCQLQPESQHQSCIVLQIEANPSRLIVHLSTFRGVTMSITSLWSRFPPSLSLISPSPCWSPISQRRLYCLSTRILSRPSTYFVTDLMPFRTVSSGLHQVVPLSTPSLLLTR